jgi:hypothetical protein
MTNGKRAAFALVLAGAGIGAARLPVTAHAAGPIGNDDMLPALLVEMKGLRAAMEQMAAGGTQAQIAVGRLQVQEHRVTTMIARLDRVHGELEAARGELQVTRQEIEVLERHEMPPGVSPVERDNELSLMKASAATAKARVDQLAAEEAQLSADVAGEQQRWITINQRLDDLERALSRR